MANFVPDHPVIQNMEQTGYPDGREPEYPRCPVCGRVADTFYYSIHHQEYVGCENCLRAQESWETWGT